MGDVQVANSVPQNRPIVQFDIQTQSLAQLRDGQSGGLIKDNPNLWSNLC